MLRNLFLQVIVPLGYLYCLLDNYFALSKGDLMLSLSLLGTLVLGIDKITGVFCLMRMWRDPRAQFRQEDMVHNLATNVLCVMLLLSYVLFHQEEERTVVSFAWASRMGVNLIVGSNTLCYGLIAWLSNRHEQSLLHQTCAAESTALLQHHCVICLESLYPKEALCQVKLCRHAFHKDCLHNWLRIKRQCPVCRVAL